MLRRGRRARPHDGGLRPVAGSELANDALDMDLDGAGRDLQGPADLLVRQAFGDLRQHLALAHRQRLQGAAVGLRLGGGAPQQPCNEWPIEKGIALKDAPDRAQNIVAAGILQQIAGGAGIDRRFQIIEAVMHGDDHDACARRHAPDLPRSSEAVHARHANVKQSQIRLVGRTGLHRFHTVAHIKGDMEIVLAADHGDETGAGNVMIVGNENGCGHPSVSCCRGATART